MRIKLCVLTGIVMGMLALLGACASAPAEETAVAPAASSTAQPSAQPTPVPAPDQTPQATAEPTAAPIVVSDDVAAMLPVMDALIRAMMENSGGYAPSDACYIWSALYLTAVNDGEALQLAETAKGGEIKAERQAMRQIAAACFESLDELPDVPDALSAAVRYDKGKDAYCFKLSDIGDSTTKIVGADVQGDTVAVTVTFTGWDEAQTYAFTLVKNADAQEAPPFAYRVRSAELLG